MTTAPAFRVAATKRQWSGEGSPHSCLELLGHAEDSGGKDADNLDLIFFCRSISFVCFGRPLLSEMKYFSKCQAVQSDFSNEEETKKEV